MLKEINGIIYRYDDKADLSKNAKVTLIDWRKTSRIFRDVPLAVDSKAADPVKELETKAAEICSKYVAEKAKGSTPEVAIVEARSK